MLVAPLIRETVDLSREAERTLDRLPETSPDHETVARVILELQLTHDRLTDARYETKALIRRSREQIDASHETLLQVEAVLYSGMIESRPAPRRRGRGPRWSDARPGD